MWSRRFEQGLVLRSPDQRLLDAGAALVWVPTLLIVLFGTIHPWARLAMVCWIAGCVFAARRRRGGEPVRAVWRAGRGWNVDLPTHSGVPARLDRATRVLPAFVALSLVLADGRRVRLLVIRRLTPARTFRRLCVLLRYGRGDG